MGVAEGVVISCFVHKNSKNVPCCMRRLYVVDLYLTDVVVLSLWLLIVLV